jgi:general stress protein YciG
MANSNPGNFANDREKASEAGRKGGHNSGTALPFFISSFNPLSE